MKTIILLCIIIILIIFCYFYNTNVEHFVTKEKSTIEYNKKLDNLTSFINENLIPEVDKLTSQNQSYFNNLLKLTDNSIVNSNYEKIKAIKLLNSNSLNDINTISNNINLIYTNLQSDPTNQIIL